MIITETQLRKMIRRQLLQELDLSTDRMSGGGAESFGKSVSAVGKMTPKEFEKAAADLFNAFKQSVPTGRTLVNLLDPTGVTAIPDIGPAGEEFKKHPTKLNGLLFVLSVLAAAPVAGKLAKLGSNALSKVSYRLKKANVG